MDPLDNTGSQDYFQSLVFDKQLVFTYHRKHLQFQVSQELFSSYQVDAGTRLLFQPLLVIWALWCTGAWRAWRDR